MTIMASLCVTGVLFAGCSSETKTESTAENTTQKEEKVEGELSYEFSGDNADTPGYAEGTITFTCNAGGTYQLYWSDDQEALKGYYEITQMELESAGDSESFNFEYHTAIPVDAKKLIVVPVQDEEKAITVDDAVAVFEIPENKQFNYTSEDALYTFNSFSDIHIDEEHWGSTPAYWWEYSENHWAQALDYATKMDVDFIVSSGDQVTNASLENLDKEWQAFQYILSQSDYVNPIYESGGNHEVRQDGAVEEELKKFMLATGLNNDMETLQENKPYYSIVEPNTGDLFIFMALEAGYRPAEYDEFTEEQLNWVEGLLEENYGKGKNIYIIQHALMSGYGPGDDLKNPYYSGSINTSLESAKRFQSILETYTDIVWISGHSHEAFELGYNYSDNNGTACNMIHNSSVGNPTHITEGAIDYTFNEGLSQGYFVQTFENAIIFSGANLCDQKIYPAYSYIIDGTTSKLEEQEQTTEPEKAQVEETEAEEEADTEITSGNIRSVVTNANTVLGVHYEYSSYNQYQELKKLYYQYKDVDADALSQEERTQIYEEFGEKIEELYNTVLTVEKIAANEPIVEENQEAVEENQ